MYPSSTLDTPLSPVYLEIGNYANYSITILTAISFFRTQKTCHQRNLLEMILPIFFLTNLYNLVGCNKMKRVCIRWYFLLSWVTIQGLKLFWIPFLNNWFKALGGSCWFWYLLGWWRRTFSSLARPPTSDKLSSFFVICSKCLWRCCMMVLLSICMISCCFSLRSNVT